MATNQERLLKIEHDAWLAKYKAQTNAANLDYIAMMADVEIPTEDEGGMMQDESEV